MDYHRETQLQPKKAHYLKAGNVETKTYPLQRPSLALSWRKSFCILNNNLGSSCQQLKQNSRIIWAVFESVWGDDKHNERHVLLCINWQIISVATWLGCHRHSPQTFNLFSCPDSQEILCTGSNTSGAAMPHAPSSSTSQTQADTPGSFTPTLAAHFDENLIRHIQGWPSENTEKQVLSAVEEMFACHGDRKRWKFRGFLFSPVLFFVSWWRRKFKDVGLGKTILARSLAHFLMHAHKLMMQYREMEWTARQPYPPGLMYLQPKLGEETNHCLVDVHLWRVPSRPRPVILSGLRATEQHEIFLCKWNQQKCAFIYAVISVPKPIDPPPSLSAEQPDLCLAGVGKTGCHFTKLSL